MLKEDESYKAKHFKAGKYQNEDCPTILIHPYVYALCTVSNYLLMICFGSTQEMTESIFRVSDQISFNKCHETPVLSIKLPILFLSAVEMLLRSVCFTNFKEHI